MQRQAGFARRKIETATAWVVYVGAEQQAGRVPMDKRTWRAKISTKLNPSRPDLRVASE
jgi:hypothetical protein